MSQNWSPFRGASVSQPAAPDQHADDKTTAWTFGCFERLTSKGLLSTYKYIKTLPYQASFELMSPPARVEGVAKKKTPKLLTTIQLLRVT